MVVNEYLDIFIEESKEHIQSLNDHLLELEKDPKNITIVNEIFRSAHTLKGMSATMGYQDLADLTHNMENVLDAVRNKKITLNSQIVDVIFNAVDALESMVFDIIDGGEGKQDVSDLVSKLDAIENGDQDIESQINKAQKLSGKTASVESELDQFELTVLQQSNEKGYQNYQVTVQLQDTTLLKAARVYMVFEILEQMGEVIKSVPSVTELEDENFEFDFTVVLVTKDTPDEIEQKIMKVSEIKSVMVNELIVNQLAGDSAIKEQDDVTEAEETSKEQAETTSTRPLTSKTIRVNIERLDALMNLFEELVTDRGRLEQISADLRHNDLEETVERMARISGDLQNIILNMRMVPIDQVFNRFPRMVRQLSRELNKEINLEIIGADTELDRTVIDEIGDPLVHLIRNALDHGIETPEIRKASGKPETGTLKLNAYHSGNHVFIEISDDGAGINRDIITKKAIDNGLITKEQAQSYSDHQVYQLIMESGFSTADKISDISGRGVGLDVVKSTIEALGGSITIDSELGKGSVFSIQLPLTLTIISVMLTKVEDETFAIPLSSILETAIIHKDNIMTAHNKQVIDFRGRVVPLISLKEIFDVPGDEQDDNYHSVVIIRQGEKMTGLIVDSFIGQQEVVLKTLGNYLSNIFAISGATILGDGQVALIVDTSALIK